MRVEFMLWGSQPHKRGVTKTLELPAVPRVGDTCELDEHWSSMRVDHVYWSLVRDEPVAVVTMHFQGPAVQDSQDFIRMATELVQDHGWTWWPKTPPA